MLHLRKNTIRKSLQTFLDISEQVLRLKLSDCTSKFCRGCVHIFHEDTFRKELFKFFDVVKRFTSEAKFESNRLIYVAMLLFFSFELGNGSLALKEMLLCRLHEPMFSIVSQSNINNKIDNRVTDIVECTTDIAFLHSSIIAQESAVKSIPKLEWASIVSTRLGMKNVKQLALFCLIHCLIQCVSTKWPPWLVHQLDMLSRNSMLACW